MESPCRIDFPKIFADVTQGNKDALEFLTVYLHFVHLIDDQIDGKPVDPDYVLLVQLEMFRVLSFNAFYQQHKASLFPVVVTSTQAYADSNKWATRPDFRDRATADVLKSDYQSVWILVAYLIGGPQHMRRISEQHRIYDYDHSGAVTHSHDQPTAPTTK